jgi:hypothetical protein
MTAHQRHRLGRATITAGCVVLLAAAPLAQGKPPVPGVTGVVEPEGSKNGGTEAVAAVAARTAQGARRLLRALGIGGDGEKDASADALASLQPGTMVAIREEPRAADRLPQDDAQTTTEVRVLEINRRTGVILVRLPDKTTATLQLVDRAGGDAAVESGAPDASGILTVSFVDDNGQRVLLSFRKVS